MEETSIIEHKSQWRDEWLQWICGFANNQGGVINIGLNDKGQPVGLQKVKKLMEDIPSKIINKLGIVPDVDQRKIDEHCGGFRVTIKRQKTDTLFGNNGTLEYQHITLESTENKGDAVLERQNVTLDDTLKSILQHISHNTKITVKELAEILEVSERHVKRYISYLKEKGFLDRTKNNRYGEWIIKK